MKKQAAEPSFAKDFTHQGFKLRALEDRINRLEEKVFKKKKAPTTLSQQIMFFHELGMLDHLYQLQISVPAQAKLLATILNADVSNTQAALYALPKREEAEIKIPFNYRFLETLFESVGLNQKAQEMNQKARKLEASTKKK